MNGLTPFAVGALSYLAIWVATPGLSISRRFVASLLLVSAMVAAVAIAHHA